MQKLPHDPADFWLTTPRLGLRRFTGDDLDWLAELRADPDVTRFAGGPKDRADSEAWLTGRVLPYYEEHPGLGNWVTISRSSGETLGFHLLNYIRGESHVQVGFFLKPAHWGHGYATEMATALLHYGFTTLDLPQIVGIASLGNLASQRVLEKSGLERNGVRDFSHPVYAGHGPFAWFERDATDWPQVVARAPRVY